jgi:hypothetical protein
MNRTVAPRQTFSRGPTARRFYDVTECNRENDKIYIYADAS